jgi:UDP-N-acetylmuramate--alanine ligase
MAEAYATPSGEAAVLIGRIVSSAPDGSAVEVLGRSVVDEPMTVHIAAAGRHNVANALLVLAAARSVGVDARAALDGLASFRGIGRRLERKGEVRGVVVYDDYGHHPTAIQATLEAVRQREPGRRVWAVYEPLTFHRTAALLDGFAAALAEADAVAIADIWAGRDPDTTVASPEALARAVTARRPGLEVAATGSVEATAAWLTTHVRPGDAVLIMGGGRSYRIGELLLERLA